MLWSVHLVMDALSSEFSLPSLRLEVESLAVIAPSAALETDSDPLSLADRVFPAEPELMPPEIEPVLPEPELRPPEIEPVLPEPELAPLEVPPEVEPAPLEVEPVPLTFAALTFEPESIPWLELLPDPELLIALSPSLSSRLIWWLSRFSS